MLLSLAMVVGLLPGVGTMKVSAAEGETDGRRTRRWCTGLASRKQCRNRNAIMQKESEDDKIMFQDMVIREAKEFVQQVSNNAWVPDKMKNEICLQVDKLLDAIHIQKKWLDESTDKLLKLSNENAVQGQMLDSILSLKLDFERINPVPTMSKLTKQCIDAYNTCIELQRKMIDKTMSELNKKNKEGKRNESLG